MTLRSALGLLLLVAVTPALAAEDADNHANAARKTVTIGRDRLVPPDLKMSSSEVLEFENFTGHPRTVRFIEPDDQVDKIRCGLVNKNSSHTPTVLFSWDYKKRLSATLLPGQFATVCSLAPGNYSYLIEAAGGVKAGTGAERKLAPKGTITVE